MQAALVAILSHTGDAARYEDYVACSRAAATPQEEQRYLLALAGFRDEALVGRTLGMALDGSIRTQDAPFLIRSLLTGTHSRAQAWAFFRANWSRMSESFSGPGLRRLCEGIQGLVTPEWEAEVKAFFHDQGYQPRRQDLGAVAGTTAHRRSAPAARRGRAEGVPGRAMSRSRGRSCRYLRRVGRVAPPATGPRS